MSEYQAHDRKTHFCIVPCPSIVPGMECSQSPAVTLLYPLAPLPSSLSVSLFCHHGQRSEIMPCCNILQWLGKLWLLWWMLNPNSHTAQAVLFCTQTVPLLFEHSCNFWLASHSLKSRSKSGLYSLNTPAVSLARFSALAVETITESWRRKLQAIATASKMTQHSSNLN